MGSTLFLIFNHTLTAEQEADASISLGVTGIVALPEDLQRIWSTVPATAPAIADWVEPVKEWILENAKEGDYLLVQGDFGATYLMVAFAMERGLIPVYSTTDREAIEEPQPDGSVKVVRQFKHVRFRRYGE